MRRLRVTWGLAVGRVEHRRGPLDHGPQQVALVRGGDALQVRDDPLEAGPGVHAGAGQGPQRPVRLLEILIEDQVPDLHDAAAAVVGTADVVARPAGAAAEQVDVDLGAGTAGAAVAGRPPEVLPVAVRLAIQGPDALGGHPDGLPDGAGFVVGRDAGLAGPGGGPDPIGVDSEPGGDELVAVGDGLVLEVTAFLEAAEGEVAQHLEEGLVGVVADLVDVRGADAALHGDDAPGRGLRRVEVEGLKGLHPGAGQEHTGVTLDDQGGAGEVEVSESLEVADEPAPHVLALHKSPL